MSDLGLTHVALPVRSLAESLSFYARYAALEVVHERKDQATGGRIAWLSDRTRPFVVVLIEVPEVKHPLLPIAHLGVGCATRGDVDRLAEQARAEGRAVYVQHRRLVQLAFEFARGDDFANEAADLFVHRAGGAAGLGHPFKQIDDDRVRGRFGDVALPDPYVHAFRPPFQIFARASNDCHCKGGAPRGARPSPERCFPPWRT